MQIQTIRQQSEEDTGSVYRVTSGYPRVGCFGLAIPSTIASPVSLRISSFWNLWLGKVYVYLHIYVFERFLDLIGMLLRGVFFFEKNKITWWFRFGIIWNLLKIVLFKSALEFAVYRDACVLFENILDFRIF